MNATAETGTRPNPALGVALLLFSALAWSISLTISYLISQEGVSVNTANASRYGLATLLVLVYLLFARSDLRLPKGTGRISFLFGLCVFSIGFFYLRSTQHLPVSLAVLLFYTAPFLVALAIRWLDREPLSLPKLLALATAFLGLALILDISGRLQLSVLGIGFAMLAAASLATLIVLSSRMPRNVNPIALNLRALGTAAALFAAAVLFERDLTLPDAGSGWIKLAAMGITVALAQITLFIGIRHVGPTLAAMLMNMEPVFTVGLAVLVLGERLSALQTAGAVLVIVAIFGISRAAPSKSGGTTHRGKQV